MAGLTAPLIDGSRLRRNSAGWFVIIGMLVIALCTGCASVPGEKPAPADSRSVDAGAVEQLGIKPVAIRLTAAGNMIDFRFRVVDPKKSLPAFDQKVKTYLIAKATGDSMGVTPDTSLGALRSSSREPETGKEYFIFFVNTGRLLKHGSTVTVVFGDYKIDNLTIE